MVCHLIALTPLIQSLEHNLVRIERTSELANCKNLQLIASGPFKGIVINKLVDAFEDCPTHSSCSFSVWISSDGGRTLKQEIRSFRFCFYSHVPFADRSTISNRFVRNLFESNFPKDYANFFKLLLYLMQTDYSQLCSIDIEMKFAVGAEQIPMPSANQLVNDGELECVSSGHVKEVLEHAYPNSVNDEILAFNLRCTLEEVQKYLKDMEEEGIVERVENQPGEWIRKAYILPQSQPSIKARGAPKIAIITCLFPEKLCVDTIMENSSTEHRYSNTGDSNIYTEGEIAGHWIVSTKLAMIGTNREAATSAGSITTRLLGKYQQIEHVIIVGVGGGQAHLTDPELHIRLGDVVISHGGFDDSSGLQIGAYVYAYNIESNVNESVEEKNFEVRDWTPKDNTLARTVRNADKYFLNAWNSNSSSLINRLNEKYKDQRLDFARPQPSSDVILQLTSNGNVIVFPHPNESRNTPLYHLGPIGSMVTFCMKPILKNQPSIVKTPLRSRNLPAGCTINQNTLEVNRSPKSNGVIDIEAGNENAADEKETNDNEGCLTITGLNGNDEDMRIVNERLQEKFRLKYHLRAFDAGFDSVIAAIVGSRVDSWVLIRGISDYQQGSSQQGKTWQNYAAANAVALVETILQNIVVS